MRWLKSRPALLLLLLGAVVAASPLWAVQGEAPAEARTCAAEEPTETRNAAEATAAETTAPVEPAPAVHQPHSQAGMRVVIDPTTGKVRQATPKEIEQFFGPSAPAALRAPDDRDLPVTTGPTGGVVLHLDTRFHKQVLATVGEDGAATVMHDVDLVVLPSPEASDELPADTETAETVETPENHPEEE